MPKCGFSFVLEPLSGTYVITRKLILPQTQHEPIWHFSIFICGGLSNTLGKANIPYMTFPFNFVAICTFIAIKPPMNLEIEVICMTSAQLKAKGRTHGGTVQ